MDHPVFIMLGRTHVVGPQGAREIPSLLARGMLATLLNEPGRGAVSIDRLVDALWDNAPASARENLRKYKRMLSTTMTSAGIGDRVWSGQRGAGGYCLPAEVGEVDVRTYQRLVGQAQRHLDGGDPATAAALFAQGLRMWQGVAGEDWPRTRRLVALAHSLNADRLDVVEQCAQALAWLGRYRDGISLLREHLANAPTRERGWVLLAATYYLAGDPATAESTVRTACQALDEVLGLGPGPALRRAREAALRHEDGWFRGFVSDQLAVA